MKLWFGSKNEYPPLRTRAFAMLIDVGLAAFLLLPAFAMISAFIYDGTPPSAQLQMILQKIMQENITSMSSIQNDPAYIEFVKSGGYKNIIIEQSAQTLCFLAMILGFWIFKQATPGKMLMSLKIVDAKTLGKPNVLQLVLRLLMYPISAIGVVYIAIDKKHRAWHDLIASTIVIYTKDNDKIKK